MTVLPGKTTAQKVEWAKQGSTGLIGGMLDVPLGALVYVIGGWTYVAVQSAAFLVAALALIVWGVRQEMRDA